MHNKLYMYKSIYNLMSFDNAYETMTTINMINMSVTPQSFFVPLYNSPPQPLGNH